MSAVLMESPDHIAFAQTLAAEVRRIAESVRRTDMRRVEEDRDDITRGRLLTSLRQWMTETAALLASAERELDDGRHGDAAAETPQQFVVDVAAVASVALSEKRQLLQHIDSTTDRWEAIDRCDRALRALGKSLTAIENALADFMGAPRHLAFDDELEKGLRIRRVYESFRQAILDHVAPEEKPLAGRLRSAGTAIVMLIGRDEYPLMRVGDRVLVRKLQRRVFEWIAAPAPNDSEGRHLCSEMLSVAELLMGISRRSELIEHDRVQTGSSATPAQEPDTNEKGEENGKDR